MFSKSLKLASLKFISIGSYYLGIIIYKIPKLSPFFSPSGEIGTDAVFIFSGTDITTRRENAPFFCPMEAPIQLIYPDDARITRQADGAYLCYLELYELDCADSLTIGFRVMRPSFFLFFMLEGQVEFRSPAGETIAGPRGGQCYATFNAAGTYQAEFPAGRHKLLYLAVQPDWLDSLGRDLPALRPLIYRFLSGEAAYGLLPPYPISAALYRQLAKLRALRAHSPAERDSLVQLNLAGILARYHELLLRDRGPHHELAYRALDYIAGYYRDPELSNGRIAAALYTTAKTLSRNFRQEFRITPHAYIIHLRMRLAQVLLQSGEATAQDVYSRAGYLDAHSFRVQFKRYYGYPPGASKKHPL